MMEVKHFALVAWGVLLVGSEMDGQNRPRSRAQLVAALAERSRMCQNLKVVMTWDGGLLSSRDQHVDGQYVHTEWCYLFPDKLRVEQAHDTRDVGWKEDPKRRVTIVTSNEIIVEEPNRRLIERIPRGERYDKSIFAEHPFVRITCWWPLDDGADPSLLGVPIDLRAAAEDNRYVLKRLYNAPGRRFSLTLREEGILDRIVVDAAMGWSVVSRRWVRYQNSINMVLSDFRNVREDIWLPCQFEWETRNLEDRRVGSSQEDMPETRVFGRIQAVEVGALSMEDFDFERRPGTVQRWRDGTKRQIVGGGLRFLEYQGEQMERLSAELLRQRGADRWLWRGVLLGSVVVLGWVGGRLARRKCNYGGL